jgi:P4 family phage/plasmid primase-like protien
MTEKITPSCGALLATWTGERYSLPPAWRPLQKPDPLRVFTIREALKTSFYDAPGEVWLYPLMATGVLVRPCREGNPETIKRELNSEITQSGIFVDIDDIDAHRNKKDQSHPAWYSLIREALEPFKNIPGFFIYNTLRGLRCGFIHEPVDLKTGQLAKLEVYFQIEQKLKELEDQAEVDRACLDVSRGFASAHINKRGFPIPPGLVKLELSNEDLPKSFVLKMAESYNRRSIDSSSQTSESKPAVKNKKAGKTSQNSKQKTLIPPQEQIDQLDGTEQYNLARSAFFAIAKIVHHKELREDILRALDKHLMGGRRAEKEPLWFERQIESIEEAIETQYEAMAGDALPEPIMLSEFPTLLPLRRVFERTEDIELADAIFESFGQAPYPLWHGDGLRQYQKESGTWSFYGHHALRRIAFSAVGAKTSAGKEVSITNSKVKGALEVLASKAGADQESPFETAPAGVVLGGHFISYCHHDGLKITNPEPGHFAIHSLDYALPSEVLEYWKSDGDHGRPPIKPSIFIDTFLRKSLTRPLEEGETQNNLNEEIEAKITTIGEWVGLALLGACTMEATALILHGKGSNGKSVMTSLVTDLFGAERTAHLSPQAMKERFSRAQLFGSAVNVVSEMPETELLASDTLKAVISGDRIEVERKHKDPFAFKPRCAHIFATNTLPASRDRSHGLWRRLVPVEFNHIFTEKDKDRGLIDKLRSEYHLLVPWCLDLARTYFLKGGYSHQNRINQWRMHWRSEVDAVANFANEELEHVDSSSEGSSIKDIWEAFLAWCIENGQHGSGKMSLKAFSRQMSSLPEVEKGRHGSKRITKINKKLKSKPFM